MNILPTLNEALFERGSRLSDEDKEKIRVPGKDEFATPGHMFMGQKLRIL